MVILVNENDEPIGSMQKLQAHLEARLHRAFSVLIFNSEGKLLLQQRALGKYHTPGLWTNTCCSHPFPNEDTERAAERRLQDEMGMSANLSYLFKFTYKHKFENELTEHETDHVFIGFTDARPIINKEEVNNYKYMYLDDIKSDIALHPEQYTAWFRIIMSHHFDYLRELSIKQAV